MRTLTVWTSVEDSRKMLTFYIVLCLLGTGKTICFSSVTILMIESGVFVHSAAST